jgi:hypothetical protein
MAGLPARSLSRLTLLLLVLTLVPGPLGCREQPGTAGAAADPGGGASCSVAPAVALAVAGRADGIYGVENLIVRPEPLVRFEEVTLTGSGVEATSHKPWLHLRLAERGARAMALFTAAPAGRSIAVVVQGEVAAHHKIRQPITTSELQVSCCNPKGCERWKKRLGAVRAGENDG